MSETVANTEQTKSRIDYKAAHAELMAEFDRIDARIVEHQADYERSRLESKVIEARIDAKLHELRRIVDQLSGRSYDRRVEADPRTRREVRPFPEKAGRGGEAGEAASR